MSIDVFTNNFSSGVISPKARRLVGTQIYNSSASRMHNVFPLTTGGFVIRDGMKPLLEQNTGIRLVPFVISAQEYYLISFSVSASYKTVMTVYGFSYDTSGDRKMCENPAEIATYDTDYGYSEVPAIRYAQDSSRIIFVHPKHPPLVLEKSGAVFLDPFQIKLKTETAIEGESFDYKGLFTMNNFPSCISFCSNRLWFASSEENPYRLWASRPFEYNNFQDVESYETLDDARTVEEYLQKLSSNKLETKFYKGGNEISGADAEKQADTKKVIITEVDLSGVQIRTTQTYSKVSTAESGGFYWDLKGTETETIGSITQPKMKVEKAVTADCALVLDVGSDRNDRISWIGTSTNIYVGTMSSEYVISREINALNPYISKIASYGSDGDVQLANGNNNIYYAQTGRRTVRTVKQGEEGAVYYNVSENCPEIFEGKIKEMHWQRVPEPRLYCVLDDGTMNILCNSDRVMAWSTHSTNGHIVSCAVLDTEEGQNVYLLVDRGNRRYIEMFREGLYTDGEAHSKIECEVETNFIDDPSIISYSKRSYNFFVDSLGADFMIGQKGTALNRPRATEEALIPVNSGTRNTRSISFTIRNVEGSEFRILAFVVELEVSK